MFGHVRAILACDASNEPDFQGKLMYQVLGERESGPFVRDHYALKTFDDTDFAKNSIQPNYQLR